VSSKIIVIPARYQSSRFPGKPLVMVRGKSMLERVWRTAKQVRGIEQVIIATDDTRIEDAAVAFGAEVVMTPVDLMNGTERVYYAASRLAKKPDVVINFQGDAVITPPWILEDLVQVIDQTPNFEMATPVVKLSPSEVAETVEAKNSGELAGVLAVFDRDHNALYFSRSLIPRHRDGKIEDWPLYRHIGIYAYSFETLERYIQLPASPLEGVEQLEQLRALENGIRIKVALTDYRGRTPGSIDTPDDLLKVEKILDVEGEIL
jgi:3-deoxy-manno-octulosonate cytidylyltransferase (CMP-KDO synthetase)